MDDARSLMMEQECEAGVVISGRVSAIFDVSLARLRKRTLLPLVGGGGSQQEGSDESVCDPLWRSIHEGSHFRCGSNLPAALVVRRKRRPPSVGHACSTYGLGDSALTRKAAIRAVQVAITAARSTVPITFAAILAPRGHR
ncbi:hypothetical protein O4H66_02245 [Comamonadaceae bacterium G21597-S1]|nr:hypothetical protein [Comamonadaceae bacterium G21597-S1]